MNKYILITLLTLLRFNLAQAFDLHAGDVLLISFNCYECRVIESETDSLFSHSGVVVMNETHELRIGQSLGFVALYPLDQFLKNKTPGTSVWVYRPKEFSNLTSTESAELEKKMLSTFRSDFAGAPFDEKYLWDNFDAKGRELLYCSEFIAKFLDRFLDTPTIPYPLSYKKNEAYWKQYFKGIVPEGVLGNSPVSFSRDDRFSFVGKF